jgi:hypothetical protein
LLIPNSDATAEAAKKGKAATSERLIYPEEHIAPEHGGRASGVSEEKCSTPVSHSVSEFTPFGPFTGDLAL